MVPLETSWNHTAARVTPLNGSRYCYHPAAARRWLLRIKSQLLIGTWRPCVQHPSPLPQVLGLWPNASSTPSLSPASGPVHLPRPLSGFLCALILLWPAPSYPSGLGSNVTFSGRLPQTTDLSGLCCPGQVVPASCCPVPRSEMLLFVIWSHTCCLPLSSKPPGARDRTCLLVQPYLSTWYIAGLTTWLRHESVNAGGHRAEGK